MNPAKNLFQRLLSLSLLFMIVFACKKENSANNNADDPFIGNWKLKAVIVGSDVIDVSNRACFKDSYFRVTSSDMKILTSIPKDNGECQKVEAAGKWEKVNGKYWEVGNNNEKTLLDISFLQDNQQMNMNANDEQGTVMVYTK